MARRSVYHTASKNRRPQNTEPFDKLAEKAGDNDDDSLIQFGKQVRELFTHAETAIDELPREIAVIYERVKNYLKLISGRTDAFAKRLAIIDDIFPAIPYEPFTVGSVFSGYVDSSGKYPGCRSGYYYGIHRPGRPQCNYSVASIRGERPIVIHPSSIASDRHRLIILLHGKSNVTPEHIAYIKAQGITQIEVARWDTDHYEYQTNGFVDLESYVNGGTSNAWVWIVIILAILILILIGIWLARRKK